MAIKHPFVSGKSDSGDATIVRPSDWNADHDLSFVNVFTNSNTVRRNAIGTTSTDSLILENQTAAAAGAQQISPRLRLTGSGWKTNSTAASQVVDWILETIPVQGAISPFSNLIFSEIINGAAAKKRLQISTEEATGNPAIDSTRLSFIDAVAGSVNYALKSTLDAASLELNAITAVYINVNGQDHVKVSNNRVDIRGSIPTTGTTTLGIKQGAAQVADNQSLVEFIAVNASSLTEIGANGELSVYKTKATAGHGLSAVYNSVALTGQTASIGSTNLTVDGGIAPAGVYKVSVYHFFTTAGTSGTLATTIGWNDGAAARTKSPAPLITAGTLVYDQGSVIVKADGANHITYLTTATAFVGSPIYSLYIVLERVA